MIGKALTTAVCGLIVIVGLLVIKHDAHDGRLQFVIDRADDYVELYFSAPAETVVDVFGLPPRSLVEADGSVDFDRLRLGTADIGDELFSRVRSSIDGTDVTFEAMSLMVHPIEDKLPLSNPIEGIIAIGVCTTENSETPVGLSQLQAYSGFIASTQNDDGTISVQLPNGGKKVLTVLVRDHTDGRLQREYVTTISADGTLVFPGTTNVTLLDRIADWGGVTFGAS